MSDEWTDFHIATYHEDQLESLRKGLKKEGMTEGQIEAQINRLKEQTVYVNSKYQVAVDEIEPKEGAGVPPLIHLSIKRRDKRQIEHDSHWRDLQRIKNEIVGEENEAVELYPAEERKVDTANQYHLWVFADPDFRLPFGFQERAIVEGGESETGARQADPDDEDAKSPEEAMQELTDQAQDLNMGY